jgi:hypothetical protein
VHSAEHLKLERHRHSIRWPWSLLRGELHHTVPFVITVYVNLTTFNDNITDDGHRTIKARLVETYTT